MRHLKRMCRHRQQPPKPDRPFALELGRKTQPPIAVPYLFFGYGILPYFRVQAEEFAPDRGAGKRPKHPIHYFRLREWMGRTDPCIVSGGVQTSQRLASAILAAEPRTIERELWKTLFSLPPSHVVRFGWKSQVNGSLHEVLYIPLNFRFSGFNTKETKALAIAWGDYFLEVLGKSPDITDLCPSSRKKAIAQQYWLIMMFFRLRWKVIEEPLEKYRSR